MTLPELSNLTSKTEAELRAWTGGLKIRIGKKKYHARVNRDGKGDYISYLDKNGGAWFFRRLKYLKQGDIVKKEIGG